MLFIGLGSIGQRHFRLLQNLPTPGPAQFFALRSGSSDTPTPAPAQALRDWNDVDRIRPHVAFICNPTSMHISTALECARRGMHLFLEKPVAHNSEGLAELRSIVRAKRLTAYVAYPLRFHPAVVAFRERVREENSSGHVRCVVSSYLPAWRPGTDHLRSYSARHEMGGGVVLDLSHEFDLVQYIFGTISVPTGIAGRMGGVTVDAEDFADAIFKAGPHIVNLHMNFMSPHAERTIELDLPGRFLRLDILAGELKSRAADPASVKLEKFPVARDEMYVAQLRYFLDNLSNPALMNNLDEASVLFEKILQFRDWALQEGQRL